MARKELENALKDFDEAIRLAPTEEAYLEARAIVLFDKKEFAKCADDFTALIKLDPKSAIRRFQRATVWENMNEPEKLITDCAEAIRLDPKLVGAYVTRGRAYIIDHLRLEIVARENNVDFDALVKYARENKKETDKTRYFYEPAKAKKDFDEAIRLDPKSAPALLMRGTLHALEGRTDDATLDLREAVRLDSTLFRAHAWLARIYEKAGKYYQALAHFGDLARLEPKSKEATDGVERVKKLAREKWGSTSVKLVSVELDTELKKVVVKKTPPYSLAKNTSQLVEEVVKVQHSTSVTEGWKAESEVRGKVSAWFAEVQTAVRGGVEKSTNRTYGVETERKRSVTITGTGEGAGPRVVWVNLYRTGKATVEIGGEQFDLPFAFWDDFILETEAGDTPKTK